MPHLRNLWIEFEKSFTMFEICQLGVFGIEF